MRLATIPSDIDRSSGSNPPRAVNAERRYKISDAVALLADGRIAVGGGYGLETYADGRFTKSGAGSYERQFPAVVALRDGAVLVTGGYDDRTRVTGTAFLAKP